MQITSSVRRTRHAAIFHACRPGIVARDILIRRDAREENKDSCVKGYARGLKQRRLIKRN